VSPPRRHPVHQTTRRPKVAGTRNRSAPKHTDDVVKPAVDGPNVEDAAEDSVPTPSAADAATDANASRDVSSEPGSEDGDPAADPELAADTPSSEPGPGWGRRMADSGLIVPAVLVLVALVVAGAGLVFRGQAELLAGGAAATNRALSDVGATTDVTTQVTHAMESVSSYKYTDLDAAQKAGQAVSTGKFLDDYNKLFTQVRDQAPKQKAVVAGQVVKIAVRALQDDNAILLAFLTQTTTRADNGQSNSIGLVYTVNARLVDGKWKIQDLTPR